MLMMYVIVKNFLCRSTGSYIHFSCCVDFFFFFFSYSASEPSLLISPSLLDFDSFPLQKDIFPFGPRLCCTFLLCAKKQFFILHRTLRNGTRPLKGRRAQNLREKCPLNLCESFPSNKAFAKVILFIDFLCLLSLPTIILKVNNEIVWKASIIVVLSELKPKLVSSSSFFFSISIFLHENL